MTTDHRITDLLIHWEDLYQQGKELTPRELCRDCPELEEAVAVEIAKLKEFALMANGSQVCPLNSEKPARQPRRGQVPFRPGEEITAGCRLIRKLGAGGFGGVYLADWRGEKVAVKCYHGSLDSPVDRRRVEFELEGLNLIKKVRHGSILKIHATLVEEDLIALVTELADTTLDRLFAQWRESCSNVELCDKALQLLRGPARAIDYLLARYGLMHLDVKPENLLLVEGQCKLADFGTMKQLCGRHPPGSITLCAPANGDSGLRTTVTYRSWQDVPWRQALDQRVILFTGP